MKHEFNVLIIGGGIVGLTAALAMAQRGHTVAVIDAGALKTELKNIDPRVYAINQASRNLFEQLQVWSHLDAQRISPYCQMYVWDALSKAHIDFDSRMVANSSLGAIIEESVLKKALLQQIYLQPEISLFPECIVDDVCIMDKQVTVSSQQQQWQGQLLMIADGANSPTRQKLNVSLTSWPYQQQAIVTTVAVENAHNKTAYQVFNPDGPLAFLPLADEHQCSIVWSTDPQRAKHLMALNDEEFSLELGKAFAHKLGNVNIITTRYQFPLQMRHVNDYSGNRWILLGDAAHTIHPLAGLGLNVGLADIHSWLNCLDRSKASLISKKALGAYQRERKYQVWQIIVLMEGFKRLFSSSFAPLVTLRTLGLNFCNNFALLKRLFIQHARGT